MKPIAIATSIPYVNADPHIGFALELLYADVRARFLRTREHEVLFGTGTDEHGLKIAQAAAKNNRTPLEQTNVYAERFKQLCTVLLISHTDFVRTTEPRHEKVAQALWNILMERGYVEKRRYEGLYCVGCEAFKTEKDLVDGKCPDHPTLEIQHTAEENYFFLLSKLQTSIEGYFHLHPEFVIPEYRFSEMKEFVKRGLEDVSITREKEKIGWGIAVPNDDSQVMYVWFEALMNYFTVTHYGVEDFQKWWPVDSIFVGKDINRFHSVMFLGMCIALGLPAPKHIAVHGHITVDGQKMSKSVGNVVDPFALVEKYGVDTVRYFLLSQIAMQNDGDFSEERLREMYTAHLANGLGNLCSRVTNMIEKYCGGVVPEVSVDGPEIAIERHVMSYDYSGALAEVWIHITNVNQDIEQMQPWKSIETEPDATKKALGHWYYKLIEVAKALESFMPITSQNILGQLKDSSHITKMNPLFPRLS
ncbi:MAG: methionine--tRNA ligase [Candidatus Kerfeldbacteria bacterium]|nr:methionine--tRNA ligase [Candidatus Kerfeldbacteria bacterium]